MCSKETSKIIHQGTDYSYLLCHTPMPSSDSFGRISTDILGPLSLCTNSKNRYVLVFVDSFTKYIEPIPLANISGTTVASTFLHTIICRHGTPRFLHSDRGTNYLSQIVKETCKLINIKKTQTSSYHSSCDGQSERMKSFITTFLAKNIDGAQDNRDELIPFVQFAYNTGPCLDSTEYPPYFLVDGTLHHLWGHYSATWKWPEHRQKTFSKNEKKLWPSEL